MSSIGKSAAVAALLATVLLAAGCAGTDIDPQKVEEQVKASSENISGSKVSTVECPSGIAVEPGTAFTCSVKYSSGKEATAKLKIRDDEADLDFVDLSAGK